eukprot:11517771-Karenia_brevis.AAC.1
MPQADHEMHIETAQCAFHHAPMPTLRACAKGRDEAHYIRVTAVLHHCQLLTRTVMAVLKLIP